ncbi:Elongation of very long chain fatty acids protein 1 [Halotydeus destructor]|nr:Elongation of very long chain fatty acids protein 1 [Halotydeus destructor]
MANALSYVPNWAAMTASWISPSPPLTYQMLRTADNISRADVVRYMYYDFWEEHGDPRIRHLPLIRGGPWFTIIGVLLYLALVKVIGPWVMRDRKPYELRTAMIVHNGYLSIGNTVGFLFGIWFLKGGASCFGCQPLNVASLTTEDKVQIYLGYLYYLSKYVDFLDTFFFVLRKSDRQVSFLHVFHHGIMPVACYTGLKFIPGGNASMVPFINTGVHAIMYTYYGLSAIGPHMQPYLWWKRYITIIQVIQFVIIGIHAIYGFVTPNCSYHKFFHLMQLAYAAIFFNMFFSFYRASYNKVPQDKAKLQNGVRGQNNNADNNNKKKLL